MSTTFDLSKCERNAQGHWLCQTRDGREARVICADIKGRQDLLALITNLAGIEYSIILFKDGRYSPTEDTANDLINL